MSNEATKADRNEISAELQKKIVEALSEKIPGGARCTACGKSGLTLVNHFVTPTIMSPNGDYMIGGGGYPQIMLVCGNCGNTRYHNTMVLGVYNGRP